MENNNNKPIKTYRAGAINLSVWENTLEDNNKIHTITFQRNFKDENTDKWKKTQNLRISDLPKLKVLIEEAYKDLILK